MLLKVRLPSWWTEVDFAVFGYTDALDTFCCSAIAAWWVVVGGPFQPQSEEIFDFEYEGYFAKHDLQPIPMADHERCLALEALSEFDF